MEKVRAWRRAFDNRKFDLRLFWFDQDPALKPLMLGLAGGPASLVPIEDFGALQEPFFRTIDEELIAEDVRLRRAERDGSHHRQALEDPP